MGLRGGEEIICGQAAADSPSGLGETGRPDAGIVLDIQCQLAAEPFSLAYPVSIHGEQIRLFLFHSISASQAQNCWAKRLPLTDPHQVLPSGANAL